MCYIIWYNQFYCLPREIHASKFVLVQLPGFFTHRFNGTFCECVPPIESKVGGFRMKKSVSPHLRAEWEVLIMNSHIFKCKYYFFDWKYGCLSEPADVTFREVFESQVT